VVGAAELKVMAWARRCVHAAAAVSAQAGAGPSCACEPVALRCRPVPTPARPAPHPPRRPPCALQAGGGPGRLVRRAAEVRARGFGGLPRAALRRARPQMLPEGPQPAPEQDRPAAAPLLGLGPQARLPTPGVQPQRRRAGGRAAARPARPARPAGPQRRRRRRGGRAAGTGGAPPAPAPSRAAGALPRQTNAPCPPPPPPPPRRPSGPPPPCSPTSAASLNPCTHTPHQLHPPPHPARPHRRPPGRRGPRWTCGPRAPRGRASPAS
jgi:hypothetical protein